MALKIASAYGGRFVQAIVSLLQIDSIRFAKTKMLCLELVVALIACCNGFIARVRGSTDLQIITDSLSMHGSCFGSGRVSAAWADSCLANTRQAIQQLKRQYRQECAVYEEKQARRPASAQCTRANPNPNLKVNIYSVLFRKNSLLTATQAQSETKRRLQLVVRLLDALQSEGAPAAVLGQETPRAAKTAAALRPRIKPATAAADEDEDAGVAADDGDSDSSAGGGSLTARFRAVFSSPTIAWRSSSSGRRTLGWATSSGR